MDLIIYTRDGCEKCKALKLFLNKYNIPYEEKDIQAKEYARELLFNEYIINNFCDSNLCIVITPIVNFNGKWMHEEFFNDGSFNSDIAKKIFNISK